MKMEKRHQINRPLVILLRDRLWNKVYNDNTLDTNFVHLLRIKMFNSSSIIKTLFNSLESL
jgi:hypothetical protein